MTKRKLATALAQRPLSDVRDVVGNFKKMLKPRGGQEKFPFSFLMRQWWPPQHKGGVRKSVFTAKRLALVVIERPKGITHFYLSIALTKRGDKPF